MAYPLILRSTIAPKEAEILSMRYLQGLRQHNGVNGPEILPKNRAAQHKLQPKQQHYG